MINYEVTISGGNLKDEIKFQIEKKNEHEVLAHAKEKFPDYDVITIYTIEDGVPKPLYKERKEPPAEGKVIHHGFQDSGWISLYTIAGWVCVVGGIVVPAISESSSEVGYVFFFCALLAASANFFAAHILRLQEKTAAFTETTSEIMVKHHELMVENVNLLRSIAQKNIDKGK